jgi:hydroxyacylglutathione hydrolase
MQIKERDEFVRQMIDNLPDRPAYFSYDVDLNLKGAEPFSNLPALKEMTEEELKRATQRGAVALDVRSPAAFGAGHFPGSLNIGIGSPSFSSWTGFMVPGEKAIVVVVGSPNDAKKARLELARIGFDNLLGYVKADSLGEKQTLPQTSVQELKKRLAQDGQFLLDVRSPGGWRSEKIDSAQHVPVARIAKELPDSLPNDRPIAVICGSGYRSSIVSSLLQARGYRDVQNVAGGMTAFLEED